MYDNIEGDAILLVEENVHNVCPQFISVSHTNTLSNAQERSVTAKTGTDA
jgi:hypothetical protein